MWSISSDLPAKGQIGRKMMKGERAGSSYLLPCTHTWLIVQTGLITHTFLCSSRELAGECGPTPLEIWVSDIVWSFVIMIIIALIHSRPILLVLVFGWKVMIHQHNYNGRGKIFWATSFHLSLKMASHSSLKLASHSSEEWGKRWERPWARQDTIFPLGTCWHVISCSLLSVCCQIVFM